MKRLSIVALIALSSALSVKAAEKGKHLFILSGQSNMALLNPNHSFTPAVQAEFGKDHVIVVKDALGGQPIRRWYKKWPGTLPNVQDEVVNKPKKRKKGKRKVVAPKEYGDLYDRLMVKVNQALAGARPDTVTFIWMQGEKDASQKNDHIYKESLLGLIKQLSDDMKRDDVNYVIGRLSQYRKDAHWEGVRKAQVEAAEASPRGAWVDTDDVDIVKIHYSAAGYKDLGSRFAKKAIALIRKHRWGTGSDRSDPN